MIDNNGYLFALCEVYDADCEDKRVNRIVQYKLRSDEFAGRFNKEDIRRS